MKLYVAELAFALVAIAGCGEASRARVSDKELAGNYVIDFQNMTFTATGQQMVAVRAKEQLTLNPDKTYTQIFSSATRKFTNHSRW